MSEHTFDLNTRAEVKPEDCGKRISLNEIRFAQNYYMLYDGTVHKVTLHELFTEGGADKLRISYLNTEENYLGEARENDYIIDLSVLMPRFYETR